MTVSKDSKAAKQRVRDEQIAAEPQMLPLELPPDAPATPMETQKHSLEPWSAFDDDGTGTSPGILSDKVNAGGNFYVAQFNNFNDAVHAAACVNGCKEINPETVPEMLAALKLVQVFAVRRPPGIDPEAWEDAMDAVCEAVSKATR